MHALRSLTVVQRRLLLALFACALVLRIAIPSGWMPVADAGGWRLTVCDGMGPAAAMAAMPGMAHHQHAPPPHDQGDHPCTFAGLALAVALPDLVPVPVVPAPLAMAPPAVAGLVAIGRGLAAPPPPATGPPAFA
ncbi:MAG TPA: hypothetical protein VFT56_03830 [Sphingomonas sp.]|nr:hypothetical protein [Sphingomonas sp.]